MRKAFMAMRCSSLYDISVCLAVIRPASRGTFSTLLNSYRDFIGSETNLIFDDDVIDLISSKCGVSFAEADRVRRIFGKSDKDGMKRFFCSAEFKKMDRASRMALGARLRALAKYSFCKSHAMSYAQLIYSLAYMKVKHPQIFWKNVYKHADTRYKTFVYESICHKYGVDFSSEKKSIQSVYSMHGKRRKNAEFESMSVEQQFSKYFSWNFGKFGFFPGCHLTPVCNDSRQHYIFKGVVAYKRTLSGGNQKKKKIVCLVCYDFEKFFELCCEQSNFAYVMSGTCFYNERDINYELLLPKINIQ
jgi:hypothetical protein